MAPALLLLAACADLRKLPENVCGNGVLESGEACDPPEGADVGSCVACQLTCAESTDCPTGSACGDDGICRHGTGRFELVGRYDVPIDWFDVGTVDGDATLDVFGRSGGTVWYYRGDGAAGFALGQSLPGSWAGGAPPVFGHIDADRQFDVVTAPAPGMIEVRRALPGGWVDVPQTWMPVGNGPSSGWVVPARTPGSAPFHELASIELDSPSDSVVVLIRHLDGTLGDPVTFPFPAGGVGAYAPVAADLDGDGDDELLYGFPGEGALAVVELDAATSLVATVPLSGVIVGAPLTADVDGDGRRDILIEVRLNETLTEIEVIRQTAPLTFAAAAPDPRFAPPLLAVADLDGDGVVDYVSDAGVFLARGATFLQVAEASAPWTRVAIGDFNRDGQDDVAAARDDAIDVLLGGAAGLFAPWSLPFAAPTSLAVGDFDGDRFPDLAVSSVDDAAIFYGRPDGPPDHRVDLHAGGSLAAALFHDDVFPLDDIAELVMSSTSELASLLRVFAGSTARTPYAALQPGFAPSALSIHDDLGPGVVALAPGAAAYAATVVLGESRPLPLSGGCGTLAPCAFGFTAPLPVSFERYQGDDYLAGVECGNDVDTTRVLMCDVGPASVDEIEVFPNGTGIAHALEVDDVDLDGVDDLVVRYRTAGEVDTLRVLFNVDFDFNHQPLQLWEPELLGYAVGNIDGDAALEIVTSGEGQVVARELIDRLLQFEPLVVVPDDAGDPRLGDLDGDGVLDLVLGTPDGFAVYRGVPDQD